MKNSDWHKNLQEKLASHKKAQDDKPFLDDPMDEMDDGIRDLDAVFDDLTAGLEDLEAAEVNDPKWEGMVQDVWTPYLALYEYAGNLKGVLDIKVGKTEKEAQEESYADEDFPDEPALRIAEEMYEAQIKAMVDGLSKYPPEDQQEIWNSMITHTSGLDVMQDALRERLRAAGINVDEVETYWLDAD